MPSRRNGARSRPPLLFVHGGYCDAWCWEPYFLPFFAKNGFAAHALSLRGHGKSLGADLLWAAGLDDYVADVERVAATLPEPPILVGHSMGAAIIERMMATRPIRAGVLLAPLPPLGLMAIATRLATEHPDYARYMSKFDPLRVTAEVLDALEPYYFSDDVDADVLATAARHLNPESPRALMDLSLRLHWMLPPRDAPPVLVIGAGGDRICRPLEVRATARHHGVEALIVPGLAHMLMLERKWEQVASPILQFAARL